MYTYCKSLTIKIPCIPKTKTHPSQKCTTIAGTKTTKCCLICSLLLWSSVSRAAEYITNLMLAQYHQSQYTYNKDLLIINNCGLPCDGH